MNYIKLFLICSAILILNIPDLADARAGGGRSMGSRGARTYQSPRSSYNVQPIERSATASPKLNQPGTSQPLINNTQPFNNGSTGGSFWRGMAGGLLGASIGSMLFGHSGYANGMGAPGVGGSAIGGLLQIALIGGLIYFAFRLFRGRAVTNNVPSMNNFSNFAANTNSPSNLPENNSEFTVTDSDKQYFEMLLQKIQHNWSECDLGKLRQFVTPEMLQYFSEEMSSNASRGLANKIENVQLLEANILESWREFELEYVSASLRWSAYDYMVNLDKAVNDKSYVIPVSKTEISEVEEIWTFIRSSGGNWLLSAIQQVQ